tara:strand:+ start:82 stop:537 length:456 start_codon:yes stop_codon:yes gene_type:complete
MKRIFIIFLILLSNLSLANDLSFSKDNYYKSIIESNKMQKIADRTKKNGFFSALDRAEMIVVIENSLRYSNNVSDEFLDKTDISWFFNNHKNYYEKYFRESLRMLLSYYKDKYSHENNYIVFDATKKMDKWSKFQNKLKKKHDGYFEIDSN